MKFSINAFRAAAEEYTETWGLTDRTLRDLCVSHPSHSDRAAVHAKIWIIGRTFATGLERSVESDGTQGASAAKVARHFLLKHEMIDQIFGAVAGLKEPLTVESLGLVITAHSRFLNVINEVSERSPRSFASKYMHFHAPLVPIFDDIAKNALRSRVHWLREYDRFPIPMERDDEYACYAVRFFHLYQRARRERDDVSVRLLEYSLLCPADLPPSPEPLRPG